MTRSSIGVDAGGTRTRAVAVDERGREIARTEGPAALVDRDHVDRAADTIAEVVRRVAAEAKVGLPVTALWAGVAGAGREATRAALRSALDRRRLAERVGVGTDVEAAFSDAFGDGPGILLISGTGSIAYGRSEEGATARVGGWGSVIGDEGSGWAIGREALRRVARSEDGRDPRTSLRGAVLTALTLDRVEDLVDRVADASKGRIAALAPVVVEAARAGDGVAAEIMAGAVHELELHVSAVVEALGPWNETPRLALAGGLLGKEGPLRTPLTAGLKRGLVTVVERSPDGTLGAARLARMSIGPGGAGAT